MTEQLLAPLHPDEGALTPLFQASFDDAMLREVAEADYGWKADECLALLQPMLKAGLVASDDFNLREVLELIRWSEPDDPEWSPGGQGPRGHWMRLFACTALVRFAASQRDLFEGECTTLAQLISSAIGTGATGGAGCRKCARVALLGLSWRRPGRRFSCLRHLAIGRPHGARRRSRAMVERSCYMGRGRRVSCAECAIHMVLVVAALGQMAHGSDPL